jgi:hypothetical protein
MSLAAVSVLILFALAPVDPPEAEMPPLPDRPLTVDECQPLARLTADQLRQRLGPPPHVSRQILYHRYVEQWTYERPWMIRVEIDSFRDRNQQRVTVQPIAPGKP